MFPNDIVRFNRKRDVTLRDRDNINIYLTHIRNNRPDLAGEALMNINSFRDKIITTKEYQKMIDVVNAINTQISSIHQSAYTYDTTEPATPTQGDIWLHPESQSIIRFLFNNEKLYNGAVLEVAISDTLDASATYGESSVGVTYSSSSAMATVSATGAVTFNTVSANENDTVTISANYGGSAVISFTVSVTKDSIRIIYPCYDSDLGSNRVCKITGDVSKYGSRVEEDLDARGVHLGNFIEKTFYYNNSDLVISQWTTNTATADYYICYLNHTKQTSYTTGDNLFVTTFRPSSQGFNNKDVVEFLADLGNNYVSTALTVIGKDD